MNIKIITSLSEGSHRSFMVPKKQKFFSDLLEWCIGEDSEFIPSATISQLTYSTVQVNTLLNHLHQQA